MDKLPRRDTLRIAEEAAEWLEALADPDVDTQKHFAAWLRASPRHVEEVLIMQALDTESMSIDPEKRLNVAEIVQQATENVVALHGTASPPADDPGSSDATPPAAHVRRQLLRWRWAAGLGAVAVGALLLRNFASFDHDRYITETGEQRTLQLDDGSILQVNAQTQLAVRLSGQVRQIELVRGEVLFKVAQDPRRPFTVIVGDTVVRALGTQFNVYKRASDTTVAVIDGRVQVDRLPVLAAGEQVRIAAHGQVIREASNSAAVTAWRQRRLIFRNKTIPEIASEFNRYNRSTHITVDADGLRARTYGGNFDADDPQSFIDMLSKEPYLAIEHRGGEVVIRRR